MERRWRAAMKRWEQETRVFALIGLDGHTTVAHRQVIKPLFVDRDGRK